MHCTEFIEAVGGMFAAYYETNVHFPRELKYTLAFFTRYVFKLNDATIKNKTVTNLWANFFNVSLGLTLCFIFYWV